MDKQETPQEPRIRVVSLQRAPVVDGVGEDGSPRYRTPYPLHVDPEGNVLQQDFWKGDPTAVVGFQDSVHVQRVNHFWHQVREDPTQVIGKYLVVVDSAGTYANYPTAITGVEIREMRPF